MAAHHDFTAATPARVRIVSARRSAAADAFEATVTVTLSPGNRSNALSDGVASTFPKSSHTARASLVAVSVSRSPSHVAVNPGSGSVIVLGAADTSTRDVTRPSTTNSATAIVRAGSPPANSAASGSVATAVADRGANVAASSRVATTLPSTSSVRTRHFASVDGQVFAISVMAVAAAEVVVGLGLIVAFTRRKLPLDVDTLTELRG